MKLVAVGDLFADRLENSLKNLLKYDELRPRIDVPAERRFVGFDAYQKVIEAGVDLVLLTTPPHFRPMHYAAAVKAGKHVFMEKPCCVDAPGYRLLRGRQRGSPQEAAVRGRGLAAPPPAKLPRRDPEDSRRRGGPDHVPCARISTCPAAARARRSRRRMGEMEYQIRHWNLFCWLCGDHLVEQACHEIDVANWVMDDHPLSGPRHGRRGRSASGSARATSSTTMRSSSSIAGGVRHFCQARQQPGTWSHVSDNVHGTKGIADHRHRRLGDGHGHAARSFAPRDYRGDNPYQQEHDDLFASVRGSGPYRFEGDYAATSSMTAVLGRMATYSGQLITWDEAVKSDLALGPGTLRLGRKSAGLPHADGLYPMAVPGVSRSF